jgi:rhodanese-related sulfurtransferase
LNKHSLAYIVIFFLLLIALVLFYNFNVGRSNMKTLSSSFENVSAKEARELIEEDNVFILDVRTPSEFNSSHIKGATLIPVTNAFGSYLSPDSLLEFRVDEVPKGKKILVYCKSGYRSASASEILINAGYLQVYNLVGGINAWINAGYPVVSS